MNSWAQCVIRLKKSEKGIGKLNGIDDEDVCGCYMVRLCPHDLFVTAQVDLGTCLRIHDQNLEEMELEAMLASYLIVQIWEMDEEDDANYRMARHYLRWRTLGVWVALDCVARKLCSDSSTSPAWDSFPSFFWRVSWWNTLIYGVISSLFQFSLSKGWVTCMFVYYCLVIFGHLFWRFRHSTKLGINRLIIVLLLLKKM